MKAKELAERLLDPRYADKDIILPLPGQDCMVTDCVLGTGSDEAMNDETVMLNFVTK